ncbi:MULTISPECIES: agmatinase family protein [unclassified Halorubrum]|uniref:agmatinase family protein n=1 Tax=unclassified Halorubrum TaxID=2642239 RepID=UPI000B99706F|nr:MULTISPECIES: agmatinase family protein [unclassified Halorubrum]OYR40660.1 agmatinase [Halorubrum sp. Hd13]OYR48137.1 agmatinase [Halorubrum sp. Eb13]OYR52656.1 agmatinase [Halorubrum sp. Ea1]
MFPGATTDREAASYVVVGAPLDATTTFQPGARFGPDRVRRFAETYDDYDRRTDSYFSALDVHDAGDVPTWDDVEAYLDHLAAELRSVALDDAVPLLVGGEHTVTYAGVQAVDPDVLVVCDAHLDLRDAYDGNPWSHACVTRRCLDDLGVDRAVIVGARTGSEAEWDRAADTDVEVVPPEEARAWLDGVTGDDRDGASDPFAGESVYCSVDVDGLDPGFAPGTGTMEPFGLVPREARDLVRAVAARADGFDVVEVNDRDDGQAAAVGGKLLREFVRAHAAGGD